uniref:DDE-1 domain-containing protein n=1 Tax=Meloidogyne javanica TaxID=6303 RepID=A0A915ME51_MELJA
MEENYSEDGDSSSSNVDVCELAEQMPEAVLKRKADSVLSWCGKSWMDNELIAEYLEKIPDISWNAPFKSKIMNLYSEWMFHGDKPTTSGGNLKAPQMDIYLQWIVDAWDSLSKDIIEKSFISCGVTQEDGGKLDNQIHPDGAIPNGLELLKLFS